MLDHEFLPCSQHKYGCDEKPPDAQLLVIGWNTANVFYSVGTTLRGSVWHRPVLDASENVGCIVIKSVASIPYKTISTSWAGGRCASWVGKQSAKQRSVSSSVQSLSCLPRSFSIGGTRTSKRCVPGRGGRKDNV